MTLESDQVAESPYGVCPLLVGSRVPAVTVQTAEGKPFDLAGAVADKPTVLVFYRGGW